MRPKLRPLKQDLSIFNRLDLEKPPVGVKFLYFKPEGIRQIEKSLAACEMIKEAQKGGTRSTSLRRMKTASGNYRWAGRMCRRGQKAGK